MTTASTLTYVGTAELVGTLRQPKLVLKFGYDMRHASNGQKLVEWCKSLPGRRWNPEIASWEVTSLGPNPDAVLAAAGFELFLPQEGELAGITQLQQLYMPVTMLASNNRTVLIRPRFCGYEGTQALIDNAGVWDKTRELLKMSVVDVVKGASPRRGILWDQAAIDRSHEVHANSPLLTPELGPDVAALANALEPGKVASHIKAIQAHLGGPVGKFGVDLFPYQVVGAYGTAGGHSLLADSPGVGKAHPLTEPILTPTGFRPMGDISEGDEVIGANGQPTRVEAVYPQGVLPIYRVTFDDGTFSRCTGEHLWKTISYNGADAGVHTTEQLIEKLNSNGVFIPLTKPVDLDGPTLSDEDAYRFGKQYAQELHLHDLPATASARLQVFRGVIASIGVHDWDSEWDYTSLNDTPLPHDAADALADLVRSLGGKAWDRNRAKGEFFTRLHIELPAAYADAVRDRGHDEDCACETGEWCYDDSSRLPTIAERRSITSIVLDGEEEAQCIRVAASDHLYLTRDYVVTHNTFQSLAATAVLRSQGMVIVCPPVVTTNWAREVVKSGIFAEDEIVTYRSGTKKEPVLDGAKVIIIADSLLASRPHIKHHIAIWMNKLERLTVAYDEIHRAKSMGSKRSDAVLDMVALAPHARPIGITGTPVLAGPHELVPTLEFTGHLGPVFGGAGPFLETYCTRDRFGSFHPRKSALPDLNRKLNEHVWMRRTKKDVLPFLPEKHITSVELDVDLKEYRRTHREIVEEIIEWFEAFRAQEGRMPYIEEVEEFANDNLRYASSLRMAAGMTKVPVAIEMVTEWVTGNPDEPVLVWAHHKDVIAALHETAVKAGVATGVIAGGISTAERDRLVDGFQAGEIPVLICSITAAGVGITLTRGANAIFVESDWTPALMLQAMDRQHRIGQTKEVHAEILLALGTLDEHIQGTLAKKGETLEVILGDDSNSVAVGQDMDRELMNLKQVMEQLVAEACLKMKFTPEHAPVAA